MKVESRGKFPGVKLHLEPEEVEVILAYKDSIAADPPGTLTGAGLLKKMGQKIKELQVQTPELLEERTPEQIAAIMAKEIEKQTLQLARLKAGQDWKKVDKEALEKALLKHVPKD